MAGTISVGTFTDNGVLVPINGGSWNIGSTAHVRLSTVRFFAINGMYTWNKAWVKL